MKEKVPGCESKNHPHDQCYGELWECEKCHKVICSNEGADDKHPNLCDDCWAKTQKKEKDP